MSREIEQFHKYVENNEITISLHWGVVEIRVNGSLSKVWAFNDSNHPEFQLGAE